MENPQHPPPNWEVTTRLVPADVVRGPAWFFVLLEQSKGTQRGVAAPLDQSRISKKKKVRIRVTFTPIGFFLKIRYF